MIRLSIRDNAFGHSPVAMGPMPAIAHSDKIEWDRKSPATAETIYTDALIMEAPDGAHIWLIEPYVHNGPIYDLVMRDPSRYSTIWTHDSEVLKRCPKAVFVPAGGCWIRPEDRQMFRKSKNVSIIASHARGTEGQKMRHEAIARFPEIDSYGPGYRVLPDKPGHKIDGLRDYKFQFAFESCSRNSFFTEKLIDCFATGTVPLYWGCPDIGRFFNTDGFFFVRDWSDVFEAMLTVGDEEEYTNRLPAIQDNFERAKQFYLVEGWIHDMLTK